MSLLNKAKIQLVKIRCLGRDDLSKIKITKFIAIILANIERKLECQLSSHRCNAWGAKKPGGGNNRVFLGRKDEIIVASCTESI